ncbi:S41 family peptidase [Epilithonimonas hispanica]|uniref:Peptidase S41 n=2 Tax=Epilithonimonas hispanica TaxID=358687 RepID=A0A3D9CXR2_9FLAO|nr:peptidase S41 [Epilithonimonas hispanica]
MRKLVSFFMIIFLFSCQSVKKNNLFLEKKISVEDLKKDVDFTYQKLQRFHPNLYWYITKEQLDHKFDSLKTSIIQPLTPNEFFFKLAPVVASVNEGHLRLRSLPKRYSKAEQKVLKTKKPLFAMMEYKVLGNQLFVKENKQNIGRIKVGTEIIKINDENVSDLIKKYNQLYSSDGENKTFQKYFINLAFFNFYTLEKGYLDSAKLQTKFENQITDVSIIRKKKTDKELDLDNNPQKITLEQKVQDYDSESKSYNRSFKFLKNDSAIAYIKVKSFSSAYAKKFYRETFEKIKKAKSNYLILDIRDNLGGSLSEINTLYSYLTDKDFTLIKSPEMTSKTSGMYQNYFRGQTFFSSVLRAAGYPFFLAGNYLFASKKDNKYYFREFASKPTKPKNDAFKGKIYVLINGASFSASSIISAKLKYEKRAVIVGEETGGANDGTVAGVNNTVKLPNSRLALPIGLLLIRPNIEFENKSRGVFPNYEVETGYANILNSEEDKMLNWILDDITFRNAITGKNNF